MTAVTASERGDGLDPSERWNLSAAFVYATGNRSPSPSNATSWKAILNVYGSRNGYRMVPYHRADISATLFKKTSRTGP